MTQSDMAAPLQAAKQQLRSLMKQRLADVSQEAALAQSITTLNRRRCTKQLLTAYRQSSF